MAEKDHGQLAAELAHETDRLQSESDRVGAKIDEVRSDWRRKQADGAVPGAVPAESEPEGPTRPDDSASADPPGPDTST